MSVALTRGVLFVHSAPTALCPHVEWAIGSVVDKRTDLEWTPQPAAPGMFRAELSFPSRLPEGTYEIRTYLLREGRIVAAVSRPLPVGKVGFSAQLAGWADNEGPLYGLGAIFMALFVGWIGGAVMRRI